MLERGEGVCRSLRILCISQHTHVAPTMAASQLPAVGTIDMAASFMDTSLSLSLTGPLCHLASLSCLFPCPFNSKAFGLLKLPVVVVTPQLQLLSYITAY